MIFRHLLPAALACAALACSPVAPEAATLSADPVALFPDDPGRRALGDLRYAGGVALSSSDARFGGWSAMELSPDGTRLLAISDSAYWMTATLTYDDAGDLTGLGDVTVAPMLDESGQALSGVRADAEGLADLGDGRYAVSFERDHRIWVYELGADWGRTGVATPSPLPAPPGADRLRDNAGVEALARLGDTLWAGIEYPVLDGQPNTLWRYDLTRLTTPPASAALTLTPGFGLTGLAPDGNGGLVVVERFWTRDIGNRIRIGHLPAGAIEASGGPVAPILLAALEPGMSLDNFEAVALAEVTTERRIFIMADDNYNTAQRTLLMSFVWPQD